MRKGNKLRVLVFALVLGLALNGSVLAVNAWDGDLDVVYETEELVNEAAVEEVIPDAAAEETVGVLSADDSVEVLAVDEVGQNIVPGNIIQYNGMLFRIPNGARNLINNGDFENTPAITTDGSTDVMIINGGANYEWAESAAHTGSHGLRVTGDGTWIYRHDQTKGKLYVYSCWYKLEGNANFNDGYRHIAGTVANFDGGDSYYNEIGRGIAATGGWQQLFVVYRCGDTTRFSNYTGINGGTGAICMDDMVLYEIEEVEETITVNGGSMVNWDDFSFYTETFPTAGKYVFIINYTNETPFAYNLTGVVAVMKNNQLVHLYTLDQTSVVGSVVGGALRPRSGELQIEIDVPDDGDISEYSCMSYIVERGNPFAMFGLPGDANPFVMTGAAQQ